MTLGAAPSSSAQSPRAWEAEGHNLDTQKPQGICTSFKNIGGRALSPLCPASSGTLSHWIFLTALEEGGIGSSLFVGEETGLEKQSDLLRAP